MKTDMVRGYNEKNNNFGHSVISYSFVPRINECPIYQSIYLKLVS